MTEYHNHNVSKALQPRSWRTVETHNRYLEERAAGLQTLDHCPLCAAKTIEAFTYWRIIDNKYPYDAVARVHHQIIPLRHTDGADLTHEEAAELQTLKQTALNDTYNVLLEALPRNKSIPGHLHYHLIVPKVI